MINRRFNEIFTSDCGHITGWILSNIRILMIEKGLCMKRPSTRTTWICCQLSRILFN